MRQRLHPHARYALGTGTIGLSLMLFYTQAHAQDEPEAKEAAPAADDGDPKAPEKSADDKSAEEKKAEEKAAEKPVEPEVQPAPVTELTLKELGEQSAAAIAEMEAKESAERAESGEVAFADEQTEAEVEEEEPDVNDRAGYIPGYKRGASLGLSPDSPRVAPPPGGLTIPYYAPSESEEWAFKFTGYASASMRLSTGSRDDPTDDQSGSTVHQPPRIVDFYGGFNGTNATPGGWTDLHFQYGNKTVEAHVTLTTWKQANAADYVDIRSQNWFDQSYLLFRLPVTADIGVEWTVGAFRNQYGGLGQYGAGQYNTIIIGAVKGVGSNISLRYDVSPDYTLYLEQGFMGQLGKAPANSGPTPLSPAQSAATPSSWVNHVHAGLETHGEVPWIFGLHYLTNWSQDERDQQDDPSTYWVDERFRPDGRQTVLGADVRMVNNHWGNFAVTVAHNQTTDAALLDGLGFFGTVSGFEFTKRYLGQNGTGTGSMWAGGVEYNLSWGKLLHYPEQFWGEGPDLITSVFSNAALVSSEDPLTDGRKMLKFGSEVTYKFSSWLGISGRYDHVIPDSRDSQQTFDVISPKLLFKSAWLTHEQVTLSYTRWFYGEHTHAEFPYELPQDRLDNQMFALHFGMWW